MGIFDSLSKQIGEILENNKKNSNSNINLTIEDKEGKIIGSTLAQDNKISSSHFNSDSGITPINEENIKARIEKKYKTIDSQNKVKSVLFDKLVNNVNEIISRVNNKKENTKLK